MLVDINLLPKKEKNRHIIALFVLVVIVLFSVVGIFFMTSYQAKQSQLVQLEKELAINKELKLAKENEQPQSAESQSVQELEAAIQWVEDQQSSTFYMMRTLSLLLPERGFIVDFAYKEKGDIQISVQFDSSRQAAFYLKSLTDSKLISGAKLLSLSTEKLQDEKTVESILPRYHAQYEITMDEQGIKAAMAEGVGP